jgi:hypothetical protein
MMLIVVLVTILTCRIDHGLDPGVKEAITFHIGALGQVLVSGTVPEGQTYTVPDAILPEVARSFQPYWDAFEGATLTIPFGALDQDIVVNIGVSNIDLLRGGFKKLGRERIFLSLDFMVEGHEEEPFPFKAGYRMRFTLPLDEEMVPLLELAELDRSMSLTLAYWTGSGFELIPTTQTAHQLIGEVPYLSSTIVGKAMP